MVKEKSLDILWDKQELARNLANLTGLIEADKCDRCHDEFPLGELFEYGDKFLCEDCLRKAEEPENLCPVCCREIPETSRFCGEDCESAYYREKSR